MSLALYAHPFSSYCQKVLIALYENATPFDYRVVSPENEQNGAELKRLWPLNRFPVLLDGDRPVIESSIIIEYLSRHHAGSVALLPPDTDDALEARFMDRVFDNYVMTPIQRIVFDALRPEASRDSFGVGQAHDMLENAYRWLNDRLAGRHWAAGDSFSLADCAAAPALFYADWVHPFDAALTHLRDYRARLLARPSFARAVDEARPYRGLFPLGAPDRD